MGHAMHQEKFDRHVNKTGECWLWTGAVRSNGYGVVGMNYKTVSAHRAAYELANGPIPSGAMVCHQCDVKLCVRPSHLYLGDHASNTKDAIERGRMATGSRTGARLRPERLARGDRNGSRLHPERLPRGERQHLAVLTDDEVRVIRALHSIGIPQKHIAAQFGRSTTTVNNVVLRRTWKHVA